MWIKYLLLIVFGGSFGLLAAAGVFTVLVAVGLVPRFAGRTHTSRNVVLYEEMVILGTVIGGLVSVFPEKCNLANILLAAGVQTETIRYAGSVFLVLFGIFAGMFIGCLALAIAEMLDSIPIFSRRINFRHGLGIAICAMAVGKFCGSIFYFLYKNWVSV